MIANMITLIKPEQIFFCAQTKHMKVLLRTVHMFLHKCSKIQEVQTCFRDAAVGFVKALQL